MITGLNYIGRELKANGFKVFKTIDPVLNTQNSWEIFEASEEEIYEACELSWKAFTEYRNISQELRAKFLITIADEIEALDDKLIAVYCKESGLNKERALSERTRTCFQLRSYASAIKEYSSNNIDIEEAITDRTPNPKADLRKNYLPLGPVAVFGSSNFPLAYSTAGGDTASALAVGCPVIVKSHPMHAATGELVASAIIKAAEKTNMPNGVFSNLNSSGVEVGVTLVKNKRIKAVGFTGSIRGGRALMDLAASREEPIPVFAEMGSINPVIISNKALRENSSKWVDQYSVSITNGTGQFCTNPGLLIGINSPELTQFAHDLANKISEIKPQVMLGPSIASAFNKLKEDVSSQRGVHILTKDVEANDNYAGQRVVMVSGSEFLRNPKLHQEVFGPFSMIVSCSDKTELIEIINKLEGQLTGTVIAEKSEYAEITDIVEALKYRVGRIIFNGVPTGVEVSKAMNHGGPYPASSDSRFTAVGADAMKRWLRPISYQNFPSALLPSELK